MKSEFTQSELFSQVEQTRTLHWLEGFLNEGRGVAVTIMLTNNRSSMVTIDPTQDPVQVRLHRAFLGAPLSVLRALRSYLRTRRTAAWRIVALFAGSIEPDQRIPRSLNVRGAVFNLKEINDEVNRDFFNKRLTCRIGWGRRRIPKRKRRSQSIRFGSWNRTLQTVTVNPLLDDPRVPRDFR